ncbi:hypothetical protein GB937_000095 [Aspergillus fischeri]|nr:hypothetical protein GB937_000095 [Aspergillus fischeri]
MPRDWNSRILIPRLLGSNEAYGWHFQYLTVIGLALSTLTFAVALLADLTLSARLFLVKNLLSICSAPMEWVVEHSYIHSTAPDEDYKIDERLVVPDWAYIPMHAGKSSSWSLVQICWFSRRTSYCVIDRSPTSFPSMDNQYRTSPWSIKRNRVMLLDLDRAMLQVQRMVRWILISVMSSRYPYPIFEQVPFEGRVGLFAMSAIVMALSTATLKWLYGRVNGFGTASKPKARPGALKQNGASKQNGGL